MSERTGFGLFRGGRSGRHTERWTTQRPLLDDERRAFGAAEQIDHAAADMRAQADPDNKGVDDFQKRYPKAASRLARTHGRVYLTGCGANLDADAFASLPASATMTKRRVKTRHMALPPLLFGLSRK